MYKPCLAPVHDILPPQVQAKATDIITSIDGEICYNVQLSEPLNPKEAETLAWCAPDPARSASPACT